METEKYVLRPPLAPLWLRDALRAVSFSGGTQPESDGSFLLNFAGVAAKIRIENKVACLTLSGTPGALAAVRRMLNDTELASTFRSIMSFLMPVEHYEQQQAVATKRQRDRVWQQQAAEQYARDALAARRKALLRCFQCDAKDMTSLEEQLRACGFQTSVAPDGLAAFRLGTAWIAFRTNNGIFGQIYAGADTAADLAAALGLLKQHGPRLTPIAVVPLLPPATPPMTKSAKPRRKPATKKPTETMKKSWSAKQADAAGVWVGGMTKRELRERLGPENYRALVRSLRK